MKFLDIAGYGRQDALLGFRELAEEQFGGGSGAQPFTMSMSAVAVAQPGG